MRWTLVLGAGTRFLTSVTRFFKLGALRADVLNGIGPSTTILADKGCADKIVVTKIFPIANASTTGRIAGLHAGPTTCSGIAVILAPSSDPIQAIVQILRVTIPTVSDAGVVIGGLSCSEPKEE
jgi:hypothetical protein